MREVINFPTLLFKENRIVHSKEELIDRLNEASKIGKSCEVGFYAFSVWVNTSPVLESVVIDKIIYKGTQEKLERLAEKKLKEGIESVLIFDGERYLLFTKEGCDSLEDLLRKQEPGVEVITNVTGKFIFPGYTNLKTGKVSRIIKKWKLNG